jgi:hypothetical protein
MTDDGRRTTDNGRRTTDDGRRTTDNGRWTRGDGQRTTPHWVPETGPDPLGVLTTHWVLTALQ